MSSVRFDDAMARQTAERLDSLADLLDHTLRDNSHALAPAPAGADAVSEHAVRTFGDVAASYRQSYAQGVHELRKLAANLRSHTRRFRAADHAGAEVFPALTESLEVSREQPS